MTQRGVVHAYLILGATEIADYTFFVALIAAALRIPTDDWLPEAEGNLGSNFELAPGEIVYSAMMPPEAQRRLLGSD